MIADYRGISEDDVEDYPDETAASAGGREITYRDAWRIVCSPMYRDAIQEYHAFKSFGLPFSGGWKEQPITWIHSVSAVIAAVEKIKAKEAKKWQ